MGVKLLINNLKNCIAAKQPLQMGNVLKKHAPTLPQLEPYIFFSQKKHTRNLIYKNELFELVLFCWAPGHATSIHDHDKQYGYAMVIDGVLRVTNYELNEQGSLTFLNTMEIKKGDVDGPVGIHRIANTSQDKAISLHVYSAPLTKMQIYSDDLKYLRKYYLNYTSMYGKSMYSNKKDNNN
ncbi:MAG: hypothetical protein RLZ12_485 [Bacillota bacterium]|jgi:cysteine dioxygenase